jgi:pimeloyl-ACP methyl ester carboxylesterase
VKIRANSIEMNYALSGEGECIVLIHGFSDNLNMWYNQAPEFSGRYRVPTYDVRGFGQTEVTGAPYSISLFAEDLYELLAALGIRRACVLGYSMGGRIAVEFALAHPKMTTGLIFANSGIGARPSADMEERRRMMAGILQQGDNALIADIMTVASFSPGLDSRDQATFQRYKNIKLQNDPSEYHAIMQAIVQSIDEPVDLSSLACPVLIIAGDSDGLMELGVAKSMKESIRDAELIVLPTGHAAALEAPAEFNRVVLGFVEQLKWT